MEVNTDGFFLTDSGKFGSPVAWRLSSQVIEVALCRLDLVAGDAPIFCLRVTHCRSVERRYERTPVFWAEKPLPLMNKVPMHASMRWRCAGSIYVAGVRIRTRIFFCGDPHGHFEHIHAAVREHRPAGIVLLGDVQSREPLELALKPILDLTEIWWIHGNHDTDSDADYDNLFGSALADRNLDGRVVEVAGTRIAGLGGIFRGQIWDAPDAPLSAGCAWH
jgi:Calcineurin-like phosphoesterase